MPSGVILPGLCRSTVLGKAKTILRQEARYRVELNLHSGLSLKARPRRV